MNQVDLGEFMVFCKDFSVKLNKAKITEVFKKCSVNHKPLKFEHFQKAINKLGIELNKKKIEDIDKKINEINRQLQ